MRLATNPERAAADMALLAINAENIRGVRPRDWTPELAESMVGSPSERPRVTPELYSYCRDIDLGKIDSALGHLEKTLVASGHAGKPVRQILYLEASAAAATFCQNVAVARTWRERAAKLGSFRFGEASAAAIAICEARWADALRDLAESRRKVLKIHPGSGLAIMALERLAEREALCQRALDDARLQ